MNIRIITHHDVLNHGAILQLYALEKVLSQYDKNVCALDYSKNYDFLEDYANVKYNISLKSIPYYLGYLVQKGFGRTLFNVKKKSILDDFRKNKHMVGEYYSRCQELDAVFVGSDEVFSIEPGLNPFFWGMGVPSKHVFAYAGCFGPTTIDFIKEKYAEEYIKAGIDRFEKISVRDLNSQTIIETLSGKKVCQICDPVILYGYINEMKNFKKPVSDKYLLIYAYDERMNDDQEVAEIKKFAKQRNLKIVSVGFYHKWCDKCVNVDPIELLEWVKGAECVITDTFHGTVMSMIMNTPFATKIRGNRNKLGFLLSEYTMEDREIRDFTDISSIFEKKMDFDKINDIIATKRQEGFEYIKDCLQGVQ